MCLTPACPRSPVLLSRHGTRYIRHRWRHAGWLSIGHTPPCGRWHRYPRLEAADGVYAWLDPAEQWQAGRQQPKREKRAGQNYIKVRGNNSWANLLSRMTVSDRRWPPSVIHVTFHRK